MQGLLIVLLCSFLSNSFAQKWKVSGVVSNEETGERIKSGHIFVKETKAFTSIKEDGSYDIKDLKPGSYTFTFFSEGFNAKKVKILLEKDSVFDISLTFLSKELEEVEITDSEEGIGLRSLRDVEGTSIYASKKTERIQI